MPLPGTIRSFFHYLLIGVGGLFTLLVLLTGLAYYIAVSDQERVPVIVGEAFRDNFGAEATFGHYRFQYLEHFPFLSLALEDVVLHDPCFEDHGRELLRIEEVSAVFRPWKLLRREFEIRSISVDSAHIQLYRSIDGYFNASFLEKDSMAFLNEASDTSASFSINRVEVKALSFDFEDVLRSKRFRFDIGHSNIEFSSPEQGRRLQLRGDWFFHGLYFKLKNGPYFRKQESRIALEVEWGGPGGGIRLLPSTAVFGQDTLNLEGAIEAGDTSHIRLAISSPGILLDNARPLLADNVQKGLSGFSLSEPVAVTVGIEGPLLPGKTQPLDLKFQVDNTVLATDAVRLAGAVLRGRYINNCDASGPITPHSDCLDIELLRARLFDTIALSATYHAEDMKAPMTEVQGKLETALVGLNTFLPPGQLQFREGRGTASFTLSGRMDNPMAASAGRQEIRVSGSGQVQQAAIHYLPMGLEMEGLNADFSFDEKNLWLSRLSMRAGGEPYRLRGAVYGLVANLFGEKHPMLASLDVQADHLDFGAFLDAKGRYSPQAGNRRNRKVGGGLTARLEAEVRVKAKEATYRKLRASDAVFTARLSNDCSPGGKTCLLIDNLSAHIFDNIPIDATLRLDELDDPVLDMSLKLVSPLSGLNGMMPQDKLVLKSGKLAMQMRYHGRLSDYSGLDEKALRGKLEGRGTISAGAADYIPRGYKFRGFNGAFRFDGHNLAADSLEFVLNENRARANGVVKGLLPFIFNSGNKVQAELDITTPELDLNRFPAGGKNGENAKRKPANLTRATQTLESALARVEGVLSVKADKLHFRTLSLDEVAFKGRLLPGCEEQGASSACIKVEHLSAKLFGTASFHSSFTVTNLDDPLFKADVQVDMPLKELNRMTAPGQFRFGRGAVSVGFHYEGRPHGAFDVENALLKAKLQGKGQISGGAFEYKPRGYRFSEVDTRFRFDEKDLFIDDIQLQLNGNEMKGSGRFYGFLPFLFLPGRELKTSLQVSARKFDLDKFKAPQKFLQPSPGKPRDSTVVTRLINAGLENIHATLGLSIDSVRYRNFRASEVKGELTMKPGMLRFDSTAMSLCDGNFLLNGEIKGLEENQPDIDVEVAFRNTDIRQVFQSFDNFGQQDLTFHNIRGQLNADVRFNARANANYDLLPGSMKGAFRVKVKNGALINLPALDSLQGLLLGNRRLSNVQFATLENSFELKGQDLLVDHFFVASTALSFGVEGRYALGENSDTNLLFEVPFANLFWQNKEVEALEKLHDKKRGPSILLRATEGENGSLNFKWVLSKGK